MARPRHVTRAHAASARVGSSTVRLPEERPTHVRSQQRRYSWPRHRREGRPRQQPRQECVRAQLTRSRTPEDRSGRCRASEARAQRDLGRSRGCDGRRASRSCTTEVTSSEQPAWAEAEMSWTKLDRQRARVRPARAWLRETVRGRRAPPGREATSATQSRRPWNAVRTPLPPWRRVASTSPVCPVKTDDDRYR